jgi:hypothetical protein
VGEGKCKMETTVIVASVVMFIGFIALTLYVTSKAYSRKYKE